MNAGWWGVCMHQIDREGVKRVFVLGVQRLPPTHDAPALGDAYRTLLSESKLLLMNVFANVADGVALLPLNAPPISAAQRDLTEMVSFLENEQTMAAPSDIDAVIAAWISGPLVACRQDNTYNMAIYDGYPLLKHVAWDYLNIPATSCATERLFSAFNRLEDKTNSRLSALHFKQLLFLKANPELVASLHL